MKFFRCFKGCLLHTLLDPIVNTLTHIQYLYNNLYRPKIYFNFSKFLSKDMRHLHECSLESVTEQKQEFTSALSNRCSGNLQKFPVQQIQRNLFYHKVAGLQLVILQKVKCNQKYFWINKNYLKSFFVTIHTGNTRTYLFIFTYLLIWLFRVS